MEKSIFNIDNIINVNSVERVRVEFKAGWDKYIKESTIRTISAYANDFHNVNGGYIILGVETDQKGKPILPPRGMDRYNLDDVQRDISGESRSKITPQYLPQIFIETYQNKQIVVIWAPSGDNRPYQAPKKDGTGNTFYVRSGSETVQATGDILRQLIECAAKIPFDDRRNLEGKMDDISPIFIKRFLEDIGSYYSSIDIKDIEEIYKKMKLSVPINSHSVPKNVALLFFNEDPAKFFPGAHIEVVQFGDGSGDLLEEKDFRGPLNIQIKNCLNYLNSFGTTLIQKIPGQAETEKTVPYPYEAMEEALVNAVYHRGYDSSTEPTKIYLYPDRLEIISYPGPVSGISIDHFKPGNVIPPVPARNRRIGELLKELRLAEGRGTGIPKIQRRMKENGSPPAVFEFDENHTYFKVSLPAHPKYLIYHILRDAAHLWIVNEKDQAIYLLESSLAKRPESGILTSQLIEYLVSSDKIETAKLVLEKFEKQPKKTETTQPFFTMARSLLNLKRVEEARTVLARIPKSDNIDELIELAVLKKRTGDFRTSHQLFERIYKQKSNDPKIIQEFAQTKIKLASTLHLNNEVVVKKHLNKDSVELLRKAIQLSDDPIRTAWCWHDLAKVLTWLKAPSSEIEKAYLMAISILPEEKMFTHSYNQWRDRQR